MTVTNPHLRAQGQVAREILTAGAERGLAPLHWHISCDGTITGHIVRQPRAVAEAAMGGWTEMLGMVPQKHQAVPSSVTAEGTVRAVDGIEVPVRIKAHWSHARPEKYRAATPETIRGQAAALAEMLRMTSEWGLPPLMWVLSRLDGIPLKGTLAGETVEEVEGHCWRWANALGRRYERSWDRGTVAVAPYRWRDDDGLTARIRISGALPIRASW